MGWCELVPATRLEHLAHWAGASGLVDGAYGVAHEVEVRGRRAGDGRDGL